MLWKKVRSSFGVVSTVREGSSHRWAVKGTEVSIVRMVLSSADDEIGRRRDGVHDRADVIGRRRLDPDELAIFDKAISMFGSARG